MLSTSAAIEGLWGWGDWNETGSNYRAWVGRETLGISFGIFGIPFTWSTALGQWGWKCWIFRSFTIQPVSPSYLYGSFWKDNSEVLLWVWFGVDGNECFDVFMLLVVQCLFPRCRDMAGRDFMWSITFIKQLFLDLSNLFLNLCSGSEDYGKIVWVHLVAGWSFLCAISICLVAN